VKTLARRMARLEQATRVKHPVCPCCGGPNELWGERTLTNCVLLSHWDDDGLDYVFCNSCGQSVRGNVQDCPDGAQRIRNAVRSEIPRL
jgi:hypothetical protein